MCVILINLFWEIVLGLIGMGVVTFIFIIAEANIEKPLEHMTGFEDDSPHLFTRFMGILLLILLHVALPKIFNKDFGWCVMNTANEGSTLLRIAAYVVIGLLYRVLFIPIGRNIGSSAFWILGWHRYSQNDPIFSLAIKYWVQYFVTMWLSIWAFSWFGFDFPLFFYILITLIFCIFYGRTHSLAKLMNIPNKNEYATAIFSYVVGGVIFYLLFLKGAEYSFF